MEDLTVNNQGFEVFKGELPPQLPKPTIGFQNDQIQINRRAMRALGNPEYVNLMVNPDQKILIIKACKKDESGSAKLHPALLDITVIDSWELSCKVSTLHPPMGRHLLIHISNRIWLTLTWSLQVFNYNPFATKRCN